MHLLDVSFFIVLLQVKYTTCDAYGLMFVSRSGGFEAKSADNDDADDDDARIFENV